MFPAGFAIATSALLAKRGRRPSGALDSIHRRRMLQLAQERPGLRSSEMASHFPFGWSSFSYHLRQLLGAGLVRVERDGFDRRCHRIFAARAPVEPAEAPSLSDAGREVALLVAMNPGRTSGEIAALASIPERTVYHHLRRFDEEGLVASSSDTRYVDLRATPQLYALLGLPEPGKAVRRRGDFAT